VNGKRRRFVRLVGGGVVMAASTGTIPGCAGGSAGLVVRPEDAADPRRWALAHAQLAPSHLNLQPWLADLRRDGEIVLQCDFRRRLPQGDPGDRQLFIGCGGFLELLEMALRRRGLDVETLPFPDGTFEAVTAGRPLAMLRLGAAAKPAPEPLFEHVLSRRTNRSAYEVDRAVDEEVLTALRAVASRGLVEAGSANGGERREALRLIARSAWAIEMGNSRVWRETAGQLRVGSDEAVAHGDGIALSGFAALARAAGVFDRRALADAGSAFHRRLLQDGFRQADTATAWIWLVTPGNGREQQLEAGRAHLRLHLEATARGVALQPMTQSLQDYPEMASLRRTLHDVLMLDPERLTVQMLSRVGYSVPAGPSVRRPLSTLLMS